MFSGSIVALITPFGSDGKIDFESVEKLIDFHRANGTKAIILVGTTGEAPTLTKDEKFDLIQFCIRAAKGQIPIIAGTGTNATASTIELTQMTQKLGADAALVVTPYYNRPTQEGLYQHYRAIHEATDIPILIYNVPSRTSVEISVETVERLTQLPRIVGIKDASADLKRPVEIQKRVRADFCQLSGEDGTVLPYLVQGGAGCISVSANVAPQLCADFQAAWGKGDLVLAQKLNAQLMPLHTILFCETSPAPVKYACARLGLCREDLRLPLWKISEANRTKIDTVLRDLALMN